MLDSGASDHMTPDRSAFTEFTPLVVPVRMPNGGLTYSEGYGTIYLDLVDLHSSDLLSTLQLDRVWLMPTFDHGLLSTNKMWQEHSLTQVYTNHCQLRDRDGKPVRYATKANGLY